MLKHWDRDQLITNARILMKLSGGKIIVRGSGNNRHVHFYSASGQQCVVWLPVDGRVNDIDVDDMRDVTEEMSGYKLME